MAEIRPFRGLRYSAEAGPIAKLVAPPYDVIGLNEREAYALRSERNVVHLTLPQEQPGDRSKFVKYARSAATLAEWRKDGFLALDAQPSLYRNEQRFRVKHLGPDPFVRTALIALIKIEPYDRGIILPHEQTFPKHKEDRLRLLEATRAHLECIFGLYEDPSGQIQSAVESAPAKDRAELVSDDGVSQVFERIDDAGACAQFSNLMANKKIWIADGHHRYETALNFRAALGARPGPVAEDYMMMALTSMSDPGLVLLPTHRVLKKIPYTTDQEVLEKLGGVFEMVEMHPSHLFEQLRKVQEQGGRAFGLSLQGGRGYILQARGSSAIRQLVGDQGSEALRSLDVTVLHSVILEGPLGVRGLDEVLYTRDLDEACRWVEEGAAAAFLMNPPTVEDMRTIALGGEKMPQKSTYYFPKILSGLVLESLNDF